MILIVDMNKECKVGIKIVPSVMEGIIKRILEKYEYAQEKTYINGNTTWAVVQVCKELRGDL